MIVHGKVSVLVKFEGLTPNHVEARPRKGLKWYRNQTAISTISVSFLALCPHGLELFCRT